MGRTVCACRLSHHGVRLETRVLSRILGDGATCVCAVSICTWQFPPMIPPFTLRHASNFFLSAVSADIGVRCSECSPRPPARLPAASRQLSVPSPSSSPISAAAFALRPSPLFCPSKRFNSDQKSVRWFLGLLLLRRFMANIRFAFEAAADAAAGQPSALLARNARTRTATWPLISPPQ